MLESIIQKHHKKRGLEDVLIKPSLICQRVLRKQPLVNHDQLQSHLAAMYEAVVKIVLVMAQIQQCLCPSKGLILVNSLIDNQPIQQKLIEEEQASDSKSKRAKVQIGLSQLDQVQKISKHVHAYLLENS